MRKILFVDDESKVLDGLQRTLRPMRHEWEMAFVTGGAEALDTLAARPFDVVVSDMRMPGMNGAQLLTEVMRRYPQVVRIVLSGHSDQELILKSVGPAHQFLSKPCDTEAIKETVGRSCALRDLLAGESLQRLVSQMQTLPSLPTLYTQLVEELQSPNAAIKRVGEIISQDIGMTAKILQVINSAFFGLRRHISSPTEAVSLLGLDTVMTLVLSIQVFSQFKQDCLPLSFATALWSHSMRVGVFAKRVVQAEGCDPEMSKDAFTAGLLHDVGHLMTAANLPKEYTQMSALAQVCHLPQDEVERQVFGATHAELGAYLLGLWGLPNSIVEAVAYHHCPEQCSVQSFSPLTAVHLGDVLDCETHTARLEWRPAGLNLDYLANLGLQDRLPAWQELYSSIN